MIKTNSPHLTVRQFYVLKYSKNAEEILTVISEITGGKISNISAATKAVESVLTAINREIESNINLKIPYAPPKQEENKNHHFSCFTNDIKIVSDYTGMNFTEIYGKDYLLFRSYLHDAVIWLAEHKGEAGREFLDDAWAFMQTEPDRKALKKAAQEAEKNGE